MPGGRLVHAADEALQTRRQPAPLLFCEETAQLATTTVRLDGEPAWMQAYRGAAQFNLRPVPRKHDVLGVRAGTGIDADVGVGERDDLAVKAPLQAHAQCPAEREYFQARKRQHGPEALEREKPRDAERRHARRGEEQPGTTHAERAVRADLDAQGFRVHAAIDGNAAMTLFKPL